MNWAWLGPLDEIWRSPEFPMWVTLGAAGRSGRGYLSEPPLPGPGVVVVHDEFGLNMTLGASNVSFGMPDRGAIGAAFLPMAIATGLTSAIMDARSLQLVQADGGDQAVSGDDLSDQA